MNKQELINEVYEIIKSLETSISHQKLQLYLTINYDTSKQKLINAEKLLERLEEESDEFSEIQEMYYRDLIDELKQPVV